MLAVRKKCIWNLVYFSKNMLKITFVFDLSTDVLNFIIGKKNMTGAISQLLESVQNQQLNK